MQEAGSISRHPLAVVVRTVARTVGTPGANATASITNATAEMVTAIFLNMTILGAPTRVNLPASLSPDWSFLLIDRTRIKLGIAPRRGRLRLPTDCGAALYDLGHGHISPVLNTSPPIAADALSSSASSPRGRPYPSKFLTICEAPPSQIGFRSYIARRRLPHVSKSVCFDNHPRRCIPI